MDVGNEELSARTDFDLKVVVRVGILRGYKNFHDVHLIERIVALVEVGKDLLVDASPVDE